MNKVMLISVGTGSTVEDSIRFSIERERPEYVLFLVTAQSREVTLPKVLEKADLSAEQYECVETADENDVEKCVRDYTGALLRLRGRGYEFGDMVVDFTSGTKAMSSALVAAGLEQEVGALIYIYGERGADGRVRSGTERPMALKPHRLRARQSMGRAVELFNGGRFTACLSLLEEGMKGLSDPALEKMAATIGRLAAAYSAWDLFDHSRAHEILTELRRSHPLVKDWGLGKKLERHNRFLHALLQGGEYTRHSLVDLWNNMERRAAEGRFDDAVARAYRLLEYLAQLRLYSEHGGLRTGGMEVEALPAELRADYEKKRGEGGRVNLGLREAYDLLDRLGDGVGAAFKKMLSRSNERGNIKTLLRLRNESILAHGAHPIGERGYRQGASLLGELLHRAYENWDRLAPEGRFMTLDPQKVARALYQKEKER